MNFEGLRKMGRCLWEGVKRVLSPTFALADCHKRCVEEVDKDKRQEAVGALIRKYNKGYFFAAIVFAFGCVWLPVGDFGTEYRIEHVLLVAGLIWLYPMSRANEIMYAFLGDAIAKVNREDDRSNLKFGDRIGLAFWSYMELVVNFASIYYLMPERWFDKSLETYSEALYFSGVTITTLGYGDFAAQYWIPRLLSVYEVFCGFSLLIVSFTVYVSRGTNG